MTLLNGSYKNGVLTGVAPTDFNFSDMMADASHTQSEKKTTPAVA